jgi:AAA+ superfamily predicted ATPase
MNTPLTPKWVDEIVQKWNSKTYSVFIVHGNIYDVFPVNNSEGKVKYVSLKAYLANKLFKDRDYMLYYDIGDGLTFGNKEMQGKFYQWLEIYDQTEKTNYHLGGLPKDFIRLVPILRRFFLKVADEKKGITFVIDYAEKIVPASNGNGASMDERMSVVSLLKWGTSPEMRFSDIGIFLMTEGISELQDDLVRNPHIAQVNIDLPNKEEREYFLTNSEWVSSLILDATIDAKENLKYDPKDIRNHGDFDIPTLAARTSGLNIVRIQHLLAEALHNGMKLTWQYVAQCKKKLIEEYCQGLVKFVEPDVKKNLECVATHVAAKKKLQEIVWLIKNGRTDVLERGILLPGRIGVGKSYLIYCFASECGLPVMEIGDFRSKWVGDTEKQQSRILMTIKALGPVIVVVDEADAVFGNRHADGDSGVSSRVFAGFAAHIGDSSLRGREVWIAMTSRPDMMAIDMKRQGRFGLCIPLFPSQNVDEAMDLFAVQAKINKVELTEESKNYIKDWYWRYQKELTGSDVEAIVLRAKERAALESRNNVTEEDFKNAVDTFIDPLDPILLNLQMLAAVLACSDKRYLPQRFVDQDRGELYKQFLQAKMELQML